MEIYFILTEPSVSGNIGSAARAINTMGFKYLRLIRPCPHLNDEAKMLAHGSHEILENAEVFDSFEKGIEDLDYIIGTTAKKKRTKFDLFLITEAKDLIVSKQNSLNKVGILFGCESSGLTVEQAASCDIMSYITLAQPYPSLNLSQAVMLYAYEFASLNTLRSKQNNVSDSRSYDTLKSKAKTILEQTTIIKNPTKFNRIMDRLALLGDDDIQLLHAVCNELTK